MKEIFLDFPMWFRIFVVAGGLLISGFIITAFIYKFLRTKTIGLDITVGPIKADIDLDNQIEVTKEVKE